MDSVASPTTLVGALELYRDLFLTSRNLAARTRHEYSADLQDLITFLDERCFIHSLSSVEKKHLEGYLAELDRRGFAGSTRRRKVASIRSLFWFLEEQGLLTLNPARRLVPPAREHRQPRVLTE